MPAKQHRDQYIVPERVVMLYKELGETPLECLERFRQTTGNLYGSQDPAVPMTYAGRLDPMAEGKLIVLIGEECKNKERWLGLDKEYEIEVLFGVATDTGDMLGLMKKVDVASKVVDSVDLHIDTAIRECVGRFRQEYPAFSSKTSRGIQLHALARKGHLPEPMPSNEVEIFSIRLLGKEKIPGHMLADRAITQVAKVKGDFRQAPIVETWRDFAEKHGHKTFNVIRLAIHASSGTYMRSLADRLGDKIGSPAMTISIYRTRIGKY